MIPHSSGLGIAAPLSAGCCRRHKGLSFQRKTEHSSQQTRPFPESKGCKKQSRPFSPTLNIGGHMGLGPSQLSCPLRGLSSVLLFASTQAPGACKSPRLQVFPGCSLYERGLKKTQHLATDHPSLPPTSALAVSLCSFIQVGISTSPTFRSVKRC